MSTAFAAVLMIGGPILAVVVLVGILAIAGMVAYDVLESRRSAAVATHTEMDAHARARHHESAMARIHIERGIARAFVILGAAFWGISAVSASIWSHPGQESMLFIALIPFLMNIASLIMGWRFERSASVMLALTAASAAWWAAAHNFEAGVWMLFIVLLIGPMLTAAVLFWMARQGELNLAERFAVRPAELAEVPAER